MQKTKIHITANNLRKSFEEFVSELRNYLNVMRQKLGERKRTFADKTLEDNREDIRKDIEDIR